MLSPLTTTLIRSSVTFAGSERIIQASICECKCIFETRRNFPYVCLFSPVFFGEWSLASGVGDYDWWFRQMMDTQINVFKNYGAGGTFWALKNKINSAVWSFQQLVHDGIINDGTFAYYTNNQC